jgi:hypothetical protein
MPPGSAPLRRGPWPLLARPAAWARAARWPWHRRYSAGRGGGLEVTTDGVQAGGVGGQQGRLALLAVQHAVGDPQHTWGEITLDQTFKRLTKRLWLRHAEPARPPCRTLILVLAVICILFA